MRHAGEKLRQSREFAQAWLSELGQIRSASSGAGDYGSLKEAMDAAIAKVVPSQTMTTKDGRSRAQSETHKLVRDEVVKSDADLKPQAERDKLIFDIGYRPTQQYIDDTYGRGFAEMPPA